MFKIEIVAADANEMATKLAGLAEIYRVGASAVLKQSDAIARQAGINLDGSPRRETVAEAPPKRRKHKPTAEDAEIVAPTPLEAAIEETAVEPKVETLSVETVRAEMMKFVDAYAAKHHDNENAKRIAFKELLDGMKVAKLGELPEGQFPGMVALAQEKLISLA